MQPLLSLQRLRLAWLTLIAAMLLTACGSIVPSVSERAPSAHGSEVVLFSMGMIDTGYRFGGKNPEAGFDCSGMVAYIYREAIGVHVSGSAADIARRGREVNAKSLRAGDLVFFNTLNRPFSHVGIYIGDGRFVHAPSSNGRVRIDRMDNRYFAQRFEMARSYFD